MKDQEFRKKAKAHFRAGVVQHMELVRPLLLEALRQPRDDQGMLLEALVDHHTAHLGNLLVSFNMTIFGNADTAEHNIIAQLDYVKGALRSMMDGIRSGVHLADITTTNIATGQTVPYDFRDHLSKGGAS